MRKRIWAAALAAVMAWALAQSAQPALAAGTRVIAARVSSEEIQVFLKGAGEAVSAEATLGKTAVGSVECRGLREAGVSLCTLILIDNSLSIPEETRPALKDELRELVAARREGEQFALGTVSAEVTVLQNFTDDYSTLSDALEGLEFQYQDTFITDALYDYLSADPFKKLDNALVRVLLVSDGMDNKQLGYTKDELIGLLDASPMPIYALGVTSYNETSEEDLSNMFSLARATGGDSLLLEELERDQLIHTMQADWEDRTVTVPIPQEARNGGLQTLTLTLEDGATVTVDRLRMPLETIPSEAPPTAGPTPEPEPESFPLWGVVAIAVGILAVIGAIIGVVVWRARSRTRFETMSRAEELQRRMQEQDAWKEHAPPPGGGDLRGRQVHTVKLTDIHAADRVIRGPIDKAVVVGRNPDADLIVGYDPSVSGRQCEITLEAGGYYISNLSRTNITVLNNRRVNTKLSINSGDVIRMGEVEMRVDFDQ